MKVFNSVLGCDGQGKCPDLFIKLVMDVMEVLLNSTKEYPVTQHANWPCPNEAQKALYLLKPNENEYVDIQGMVLKHHQFPGLFIRQTKNAYISIISKDILEIAKDTPSKENYYNSLRKR